MCSQEQVEDEYHFFMNCELYKDERTELFLQLILHDDNVLLDDSYQSFINIMSTSDIQCIFYVCIFIKKAMNKRNLLVLNM